MARRNRAHAVVPWSLLVVGWLLISSGPARGDCPGPIVEVPGADRTGQDIPVVAPGGTLSLAGEYFFHGCNDTPGPCERGGMSDPMHDVPLDIARAEPSDEEGARWEARGVPTPLVTIDADDDGSFSVEGLRAPDQPGRYVLVLTPRPGWQPSIVMRLWVRDPTST
ncbi:MAG TPA: hypothetical protein VIB62_09775 [Actinomycetota bacterium]